VSGKIVILVATKTNLLERATRNIAGLELTSATYLNVFTVMNADHIVFTKAALQAVSDWLGEKS
jgi:ribosomal protein L4